MFLSKIETLKLETLKASSLISFHFFAFYPHHPVLPRPSPIGLPHVVQGDRSTSELNGLSPVIERDVVAASANEQDGDVEVAAPATNPNRGTHHMVRQEGINENMKLFIFDTSFKTFHFCNFHFQTFSLSKLVSWCILHFPPLPLSGPSEPPPLMVCPSGWKRNAGGGCLQTPRGGNRSTGG